MSFWLTNTDKLPPRPFNAENQLKYRVQKAQSRFIEYLPNLTITSHIRETCPLSHDEISKNSKLNQFVAYAFPDLDNLMPGFESLGERWLHLLGNFLGSGLITGGKDKLNYEGFPLLPNFKIWEHLISEVYQSFVDKTSDEAKIIENILYGLKELDACAESLDRFTKGHDSAEKAILNLSENYGRKIFRLKAGQSQPMCGGWSNIGGKQAHALIYEFVRREDNLFDVYLYTATGGLTPDVYAIGDKHRLKPVIAFKAIPEHLLLQNRDGKMRPAFIQSLIELNALKAVNSSADFDLKDVLKIFAFLEKYRMSVSLSEFGTITGQRAGTCLPSVTKVWIRRHSQHLGLYKQLMLPCKLSLMIAGYQAMQNRISEDTVIVSELRRCLKYIAKNIIRGAAKLIDSKTECGVLISAQQAIEALATAQDLLQRLSEVEDRIITDRSSLVTSCDLSSIQFNNQLQKRSGKFNVVVPWPRTANIGNHSLPELRVTFEARARLFALKETLQICKEIKLDKTHAKESLCLQIHHLVDQLPIPEFNSEKSTLPWKELSMGGQNECLNYLEDILKIYSIYSEHDNQTRSYATLITLQANIHCLAILINNGMLGEKYPQARIQYYNVPFFGQYANRIKGLIYYDSDEFERTQQVISYFSKVNEGRGMGLFEIEGKTAVKKDVVIESPGNTEFWNALLESNDVLKARVQKEGETLWPTIPEDRLQAEFDELYSRYQLRLAEWNMLSTNPSYQEIRPVMPLKRVNLPTETKNLLVLESCVSKQNNLLTECGCNYVNVLRRTHFILGEIFHKGSNPANLEVSARRDSAYEMTGFLIRTDNTVVFADELKQLMLKRDHRSLKNFHLGFLDKYLVSSRDITSCEREIAEGLALKDPPSDNILAKMLRTLSEWKLTPYQLVLEIEKDFDCLADPSMQSLFYILFFRSPVEDQQCYIGAGELVVNDRALYANCLKFIQKGLRHFDRLDKGSSGASFFFEFAFYLGKYLTDAASEGSQDLLRARAKKLCNLVSLNEWINKEKVPEKALSMMHLYRLLYYSLESIETLGAEEIGCIYESWIKSRLCIQDSNWTSPIPERFAGNYILRLTYHLAPRLNKPSVFRNRVFGKMGEGLGLIINNDRWDWDVSEWGYPTFVGRNRDNGEIITVELSKGMVHTKEGTLKGMPYYSSWAQKADFLKIFHRDNKFSYHCIGESIYFTHPSFGNFRLIPSNYYDDYMIESQFPESDQWYQHGSNSTVYLPSILNYDHTFWIPVNGPRLLDSGITITGFISRLKDNRRVLATTKQGHILEVNPDTGMPLPHTRYLNHVETQHKLSIKGMTDFECEDNILLYCDQMNRIEEIHFPRYTSIEGNPLVFLRDGTNYIWTENRQYVLPSKKAFVDLGSIQEYLFLSPKNSKECAKIFLPFCSILRGKLDNQSMDPTICLKKEEGPNEQWGLYKYFVYNILQGAVVSTCLEGQLFLAYIHLSQKKYSEAIDLIKQIKRIDTLSEISLKIFDLILLSPFSEHHPEEKMVFIFAAIAKMRHIEKTSLDVPKYYLELNQVVKLINSMECYLQSINNISLSCRCSREDEIYFLIILLQDIKYWKPKQFSSFISETTIHRFMERRTYIANDSVNSRQCALLTPEFKPDISYKDTFRPLVDFAKPTPPVQRADENDVALRARRKQYDNEVSNYINAIKRMRDWSTKGSIDLKSYILHDRNIPLNSNGLLVFESLRVAKAGSEDERNDLVYRLTMWSSNNTGQNDLLRALKILSVDPQILPDLIDSLYVMDVEFFDFLKKVDVATSSSIILPKLCKSMRATLPPAIEDPVTAFPTPNRTLFDLPPAMPASKKIELRLQLNPQEERWEQVASWKSAFMKSDENRFSKDEGKFLNFNAATQLLNADEETFHDSLTHDLKLLQEDYLEGKRQNETIVFLTIDPKDCQVMEREVMEKLLAVQRQKVFIEREIVKRANRRNLDEIIRQRDLARIGGGVQELISVDDCIECLLSFDRNSFKSKNPNLDEAQFIKDLAELTLNLEDTKSHIGQLERILDLLREISDIKKLSNPSRIYLCQKLVSELDDRYLFDCFSEEEQVLLRVFCGETKMIPFKKQIFLIKKMLKLNETEPQKYRDIVIQLIMGGGKTSVIATILLYLGARRKGRLALFVVPASLYDTVKVNFSQSMYKAFHKKIQTFDLNRKDLSPFRLKQVLEIISMAKKEGLPIIIKSTTLQILELEFLSVARNVKELQEDIVIVKQKLEQVKDKLKQSGGKFSRWDWGVEAVKARDLEKKLDQQKTYLIAKVEMHEKSLVNSLNRLKLLHQVTIEFTNVGDALLDEMDILLDCLQEVNFPDGENSSINPMWNTLLFYLYKYLLSEELSGIVRLQSNEQNLMTTQQYSKFVIAYLANKVALSFEPISAHLGEFKEPFIRYVSGTIPRSLQKFVDKGAIQVSMEGLRTFDPNVPKDYQDSQLQQDYKFLLLLRNHYNSGVEEQKDLVNLISQSRHFILELLSATLNKCGRRNYGPKPKDSTGKMIPFHAVNIPANTEFGYHWEEACYNYQWAAAFDIEEDLVSAFAEIATESARYYIQRYGETLEETAEFETFFKLFGVKLNKIEEPGMLKKATTNIANDVQKRLEFQYEIVAQTVKYRSERLSSNGGDLVDQLSSCRAMSGTPWIAEGLTPSLANRLKLDIGTEGKILDMLVKREYEGKIHAINFESIEQFMDQILTKHPSSKKIRGIIEAGGIFKVFPSNAAVAESLMNYLAAKQEIGLVDPNISGVLFFHTDPSQDQPDTLYVWRKGVSHPERIGGSSKEQLAAKGLDPKNYFVYYDERHTTGQDIPQIPEAINLFTFDVKMIRRTVAQGFMRLRQYLMSQDVEIVCTKETRENLFNKGNTASDLILGAEKVQSLRKTQDMVRYFQQQIYAIFRRQAVKRIHEKVAESLKGDLLPDFAQTVKKYETFFVTKMRDEPYLLHGSLLPITDTKEMLKSILQQRVDLFTATIPDGKAQEEVLRDSKILESHIDQATCLPKVWEDRRNNIGTELEVETRVEKLVEQEIKLEYEIEEELQLELKLYEQHPNHPLQTEKQISEVEFLEMIESLRNGNPHVNILSLQSILKKFTYGFSDTQIQYEKAFDQPLFGTPAFFYTCQNEFLLPIFHPLQKPPKQILAVQMKDQLIRWIFFSEHEADSIKKHLEKLYQENNDKVKGVWLLQPDGSFFVDGENINEFPSTETCVIQGFLEINALAGNVDYLDKHIDELEEWLKFETQLRIRFMKVRVAKDNKQNRILRSCPAIMELDKDELQNPSQHFLQARIIREKNREGRLRPDTFLQAKLLSPPKVPYLNYEFVKYLGVDTDTDFPDEITKHALKEIRSKLPDNQKLSHIINARAIEFTNLQLERLLPSQVPHLIPWQISRLPLNKVEFIEKSEQIYSRDNGGSYYLSLEQTGMLKERQAHLIPYINPLFYRQFDKQWQIQAIPCKYVNHVSDQFLSLCKKVQYKGFAQSMLNHSLLFGNPTRFGWLHGNLLPHIPKQFLEYVNEEQIREITDPLIIERLESLAPDGVEAGTWTSWLSGEQVCLIDPDTQLSYLRRAEQIQAVPIGWVMLLDAAMLPLLQGPAQIRAITTKALFARLTPNQMPWISNEQMKWVSLEQRHGLTGEQKKVYRRRHLAMAGAREQQNQRKRMLSAIGKGSLPQKNGSSE
jgi:hypothetical protein